MNRAALRMHVLGEVLGVVPEHLMAREVGHKGLTKLYVVRSMPERKALMADLSDAFVAMPGGFGTLEEFCRGCEVDATRSAGKAVRHFECAGDLLAAGGDV